MAKNCSLLLASRAGERGAKSWAAVLHGEVTENPKATLSIGQLGWTSLHWAVMLRNFDMIQRIATENPGVCASGDSRGRTALSLASELGLLEAVDLLANPELNGTDIVGRSPLMWAARRGHAGICNKLLQLRADPYQRDASRNTLMHLAALSGKRKVVDVFNKTLDTKSKAQNQLGETALFSAVHSKNISLVKYMLSELNYSANHANILGRTALFDSLRSCQNRVWQLLKGETNIDQRDYLDFRIDEMPEYKSSVCLKRTETKDLWTLDAQVTSTSFREKLVDVAGDEDFRKYLLVTLALSAVLGCMFRCWNHWRGRAALANDGFCLVSDTSDNEPTDEHTETTESSQGRVARVIRGRSSMITCCQRDLRVSVRATKIQTGAKEFAKLGWHVQRAFFARCLDVVALLVFPTIMSRVLAWWHTVTWVLVTCILPLWFRDLGPLLTRPARFLGVRDLWAWLRTAYLLMQLVWCILMNGDAWIKQHEYLWDLGSYPMSELNQISRDEFPVPFPPLLQAGWLAFEIVCALGALCVGSLWLLRRASPSDALTCIFFSLAGVFGLLLLLFWPEGEATLPVSLADILVAYRAAVLLLTLLWIMMNLPVFQSSVRCDVQAEDQVPLSKVAERVYRVAEQRRDLGSCSPGDDAFFQRHCKPETRFTTLKATLLWILDIFLDLQTVIIFAAARSYVTASLILGAFLWALLAAASAGALSKIGSALRQTVRTQVRAEEYQQVLDLEESIEVPISLIATTFSLPFVAHRPASAIMTLASIFMSLVRQASWLYEEFDVCEDMHTYMTERTPRSTSSIPKFFPED
ncbi:Tnni3k [Symbiodinium microadriaticum]|nr:Tnni3k [Symbiodinium microadriaticum]